MDRATWLRETRGDCEAQYDAVWAPGYGEKWGLYDNTTHVAYIRDLLDRLPPGSAVLDAACGAGRYEPLLLERGHVVTGIDQSAGMLARGRMFHPGVPYEQVGLQEMAYREAFDAVICVDAMENVPPEEWPAVLDNFHRALTSGGYLYFSAETLENTDLGETQQAYETARGAGLPVVYGERLDEGVYHFHPSIEQVQAWTRQAGFEILREENDEGWYYHVLARKQGA